MQKTDMSYLKKSNEVVLCLTAAVCLCLESKYTDTLIYANIEIITTIMSHKTKKFLGKKTNVEN